MFFEQKNVTWIETTKNEGEQVQNSVQQNLVELQS